MTLMRPPAANAVAEVAPDLVKRYEAQGWTNVSAPAPAPTKRRGRPKKSE